MSRVLANRLARVAAALPPPPPAAPAEDLSKLSQGELIRRFEERTDTPENRARWAELQRMSPEQLLAEWERMPRFRDTPRGRRR